MASRGINKVILIGHLGQDPEVRYTSTGVAIANLTVATSESWRDKQTNEQREQTEWHRIVIYRRLAEIAGEYLRKGAKIYIEGKLQTRQWTDQNGQTRYTTEVVGQELQMLDSRGQNASTGNKNWQPQNTQPPMPGHAPETPPSQQQPAPKTTPAAQPQPVYNEPPMDFDDDIPF